MSAVSKLHWGSLLIGALVAFAITYWMQKRKAAA